jgi:hypothetical protein
MLFVELHLHGKPGQELAEGEPVTADLLRTYADELCARLCECAEIIGKLTATGWEAEMCLYDVQLTPPAGVETARDVRRRCKSLGIDPKALHVDEVADDDEEDMLDLNEAEAN